MKITLMTVPNSFNALVKVDMHGRVVIPKQIRAALDIEKGDLVKITVTRAVVKVGDKI